MIDQSFWPENSFEVSLVIGAHDSLLANFDIIHVRSSLRVFGMRQILTGI